MQTSSSYAGRQNWILFRSRRIGEKITTQDILQAVGRIRPSVSKEVIKEFEEIAHKLVR